jgi:hypothetical protein
MANPIILRGTKIVEVPYFTEQLLDNKKSVLIIGERHGGIEGVSESVHELGFTNVCTTDILDSPEDSWLRKNTTWKHLKSDFIKFDESLQFDYIISISVFEHFGFWFAGDRMADGLSADDTCYWNHDIRGIQKACKLLKDTNSKLIITLPAGPYMNYEDSGEPFLRYYDHRRQQLIKNILLKIGFKIANERFFFSEDFVNWEEMSNEINDPKYYSVYNLYTPNVIWGLTIQKI